MIARIDNYSLRPLFCRIPMILLILTLSNACPASALAKRKGYKLETRDSFSSDSKEREMTGGSFMVASQCQDCNNGYRLEQIAFSGFDKPQTSSSETFFITNNTDRTMTGVTLYIDYLDAEGRQLNKKFYRLTCLIPPGETRQAQIKSWDKQKMFYYELSPASRKGGVPFKVVFDPVAFYLRF